MKKAPEPKKGVIRRMPRHGAFYIATIIGLVVGGVVAFIAPAFAVPVGANAMFLVYLAMAFRSIPGLTPEVLKNRADETDAPTVVIFIVVLAVVAISFYALFSALNGDGPPAAIDVVLSIVSVLLGWFVIHTMTAFHYAYEYYESPNATPGAAGPKSVGGLKFPDGEKPDGMAFLYFSYAIGTSTAVSDVGVTSNHMRAIVTVHSTFAFLFNTLIVAATVNVAVAVGGG